MELFMAIAIAILFAGGTYLILRPNLIRIVMGLALYSNAANLLMITCGGYAQELQAPFMTGDAAAASRMDPLPPDIILTAIVISFAVGALFLTMCYRVYLDHGTDNPEMLPNHENGEGDAEAPGNAAASQASSATEENDTKKADDGDAHGSHVPDVVAELAKPNPNAPQENVPTQTRTAS